MEFFKQRTEMARNLDKNLRKRFLVRGLDDGIQTEGCMIQPYDPAIADFPPGSTTTACRALSWRLARLPKQPGLESFYNTLRHIRRFYAIDDSFAGSCLDNAACRSAAAEVHD
ncbi:MAG: hypothetical protein IT160_05745 [Bryobacterales bacterium]|nr:hypothetical protein [Bryobacterales bacterium]